MTNTNSTPSVSLSRAAGKVKTMKAWVATHIKSNGERIIITVERDRDRAADLAFQYCAIDRLGDEESSNLWDFDPDLDGVIEIAPRVFDLSLRFDWTLQISRDTGTLFFAAHTHAYPHRNHLHGGLTIKEALALVGKTRGSYGTRFTFIRLFGNI